MVWLATVSCVSLGVSRDGRLEDVDVDTAPSMPALTRRAPPHYAGMMAHKLTRLYRVPHYHHHGRGGLYRRPLVGGGCRGDGVPLSATALEIAFDQVAASSASTPSTCAFENLVQPHDIDALSGLSLGDARVRACLELGAEAFGWRERLRTARGDERRRFGVGIACGAHKNGILSTDFPDFSTMALKMNEDGSVALSASLHEVGCGSRTAMALTSPKSSTEPRPGLDHRSRQRHDALTTSAVSAAGSLMSAAPPRAARRPR